MESARHEASRRTMKEYGVPFAFNYFGRLLSEQACDCVILNSLSLIIKTGKGGAQERRASIHSVAPAPLGACPVIFDRLQ